MPVPASLARKRMRDSPLPSPLPLIACAGRSSGSPCRWRDRRAAPARNGRPQSGPPKSGHRCPCRNDRPRRSAPIHGCGRKARAPRRSGRAVADIVPIDRSGASERIHPAYGKGEQRRNAAKAPHRSGLRTRWQVRQVPADCACLASWRRRHHRCRCGNACRVLLNRRSRRRRPRRIAHRRLLTGSPPPANTWLRARSVEGIC